MKSMFILLSVIFISFSCNNNDAEKENIVEALYEKRKDIKQLEEAIETAQDNLNEVDKEIDYLENTVASDLSREWDDINTFRLFRTSKEKKQQTDAYYRHLEMYRAHLNEATEKKNIIIEDLTRKRESMESFKDQEIELQKRLDLLR